MAFLRRSDEVNMDTGVMLAARNFDKAFIRLLMLLRNIATLHRHCRVASSRALSGRGRSTSDGHRRAVDVLTDRITPAIGRRGAIGEVRTSLSVTLVEPQHPFDSSVRKKAAIMFTVGTSVADMVEVAFPCRERLGKSGIVAFALALGVSNSPSPRKTL